MIENILRLVQQVMSSQYTTMVLVTLETGAFQPLAVVGMSSELEKQWWQSVPLGKLTEFVTPDMAERLFAGEVLTFDLAKQPPVPGQYYFEAQQSLSAGAWVNPKEICLIGAEIRNRPAISESEKELAQAAVRLCALVVQRERLLRERAEGQAEQQRLRAEQQRLLELVDLAHAAIILRDAAGVILTWNQGATRLYGWTEQQALGQITHSLLVTYAPLSLAALNATLEHAGQWEGLLTHTHKDGQPVIVESRQVLMRADDGTPGIILEINRDVTEREQLQRQQTAAEAHILALQHANQRMDEFLGIASHELRTPLTSISANVQMAARYLRQMTGPGASDSSNGNEPRLPRTRDLLERTHRQVVRLDRLVGDLLDVSRITGGNLELRPAPGDLGEIVREAVDAQRAVWPQRSISLHLPSTVVPLLADADRVGQVVINYLTNALKYSPEEQPVTVRLSVRGHQARLDVRDQGPGLSPQQQTRLFERFYRVPGIEQQSGSGIGLGLGLYICQTIIARHGGQVGVQSAPGRGSTFWFTLPLA
jgi:PAS domain S-box-containing protein